MEEFRNMKVGLCERNNDRQKQINMTEDQLKGLKLLQERVRRGEIVVTTTDKSGKYAVLESGLYKEAAMIHLRDREIDMKEVEETEVLLNRHASQILKAFNMGTKHGKEGQVLRMKQAFTSQGGRPGPVSLLVKDHKVMKDGDRIHPTRLVCVAKGGVGARLSNLISTVLNRVADAINAETECVSTEDALRTMLETNRKIEMEAMRDGEYAERVRRLKILSMDVTALYPSLRIESVKSILRELIVRVQEEGHQLCYTTQYGWR